VIAQLLRENALFRLRAAQGVLGLADKHGPARLELACAKAIAVGDTTYRTIKGVLAAGLEADPAPPPTGDGGAAAFLHGPSRLFRNVVALPSTNTGTGSAPVTNAAMDPATASVDQIADHVADHDVDRLPNDARVLRPPYPSRPPPTRHRQAPRRPGLRGELAQPSHGCRPKY